MKRMKNIITIFLLIFLFNSGFAQLKDITANTYVTDLAITLPYGNFSNKLPVEDSLLLGVSIVPNNIFDYKLKWSIDYGIDVIKILNDSTGLVHALKPGLAKMKCQIFYNGRDTYALRDIYVVDAPQHVKGYNMLFNTGNTDSWYGESASDTTPVYTLNLEGGFLKMVIDKAGPLDSAKLWPLSPWITPSRGYAALVLSMCPGSGVSIDMSQKPVVTMKLRTTTDCRFELGYASKYTKGNVSRVFRLIKASENFTLVSFYFGGLSTTVTNGISSVIVDSSKVSYFFLNFNAGRLNTKSCPTCSGINTLYKQPNDFKGIVEFQYIKFGDISEMVPVKEITIKQIKTDSATNIILVKPDSVISSRLFPQFKCLVAPAETTIPYVIWSTSDSTIASVKVVRTALDSGLYNNGRLTCHKPGTIKLFATASDGSGIKAETTIRFYDAVDLPVALSDIYEVYPNPVSSTLKIDQADDINVIEIIDLTGRKIIDFKNDASSTIQINMVDLTHGIYILRIRNASGHWFCKKIIKE